MRVFFDTEFIEDGRTIDLVSIGMVRDDGRTLYCESSEAKLDRASPWVIQNVLPKLMGVGVPRVEIATRILAFISPMGARQLDNDGAAKGLEFWAYYASYDWVALCQLFGTMAALPAGWPMWCHDFKQLAGSWKPAAKQSELAAHNALGDALWLRDAYDELQLHNIGLRARAAVGTADELTT